MSKDNISKEGQKEVDRLRKEYVISDEDLRSHREQLLLSKMYECQDLMEILLDKGKDDNDYIVMQKLITRLEIYIQNNQDLM